MDGCVVERSDYYKDSSVLETDNCYINAPGQGDNQGCAFNDHAPNNFGKPFNEIGGGVYATEWTSDVVNVWFFSRGDIPEDLNGPSPDPTAWGKPNAQFKGTCDFTKLLKEQRFVSFFFPPLLHTAVNTADRSTRSSTRRSAVAGPSPSGTPTRCAPKRPRPARSLSGTTPRPLRRRTGRSTT